MMKILVTGANGYLGQGIVKHLLDCGHDVVATDIRNNNIDVRAKTIEADLFKIDDPYNYFGCPDVLLHLAWRDGFEHYSDAHIDDLKEHYKFIKEMTKSNIKTIACLGSVHEIGFFEGSVKEDTPCKPTTPYGIGKNALRELCEMLCNRGKKNFIWLRGFYIVGNSEHGSSVFSKITEAEKQGKESFPFTMGQNQFDFIDYQEFCKQVTMAICQDEVLGVINVCSGKPEKIADRVENFIKENNYRIKLDYGAFPDRDYDSKAIWGDDSKIRKILNNK